MTMEVPRSNSPLFSGPETTGQVPMTPDDFTRLTGRFVASVRIVQVPELNRAQGYKADLLRLDDKTIVVDGIPQIIPQFEVQLGSYLTPEERGIALVRELSVVRENEQIRISGSINTTLIEVEQQEAVKESGAKAFYQAQRELIDGYIREITQPKQ